MRPWQRYSSPYCQTWFDIQRCTRTHARTQCCSFRVFLSTIFLPSISAWHALPSLGIPYLHPRSGKSPERPLSFNWELFSSWGLCLQPQGHAVVVPLSPPAIPAGSDPMSLLPSFALWPALSLRASPENTEEESETWHTKGLDVWTYLLKQLIFDQVESCKAC